MSGVSWLRRHLGEAAATPVLALSLLNLVDEFDQAVFGLVGPEITRDFNISAGAFGLAVVVPNVLLAMVLTIVVGYVTDRVNRVLLSIVGASVWCGFAVLTGVVPSFVLLVLVRMMTGIGRSVSGPTHSSLISDYYPVRGRGAAFSLHQNANPVGSTIGLLVGGLLVQWWGWQAAFLVLPLPGILAVVLMLRLREPRRGAFERTDDDLAQDDIEPLPMRQSLKLLNNIKSWRLFAYVWLFLAIGVAMSSVLPFYFDAVFGVSAFGRGLILASVAALTAVGATAGGLIAQRMLAKGETQRAGNLLGFSIVVSAIALLATAFAPTLSIAVFVTLFTTPLRSLAAVPVTLILSATVPPRIRGQGFGAIWFFFAIGFFFVPISLNFGDIYSYRVSVLLGVPPLIVAAILAFSAARHIADDIRRATKVGAAELEVRRRKAAGEKIDLLEVVDLDVAYGNVQVLFGVDLRVADGEMVALLGTNGAGKSTLLRAISGLVKPSRGVVLYDGQDVTGLDAEATTARGIIHVPGGRGVFPGLTVRRNLRLGTYLYRRDKKYSAESFDRMLEVFPRLGERLDQAAGTLSGGEQQMVTLAQAFMAKPRILIIDELSLGLAPVLVEDLLQVVESINRQGVTVILVEQSVNIALTLAHRAYFMEKGEVRFEGASAELLERDDIVRSVFLAGAGRATLVGS